jgi:hypothetical protein
MDPPSGFVGKAHAFVKKKPKNYCKHFKHLIQIAQLM